MEGLNKLYDLFDLIFDLNFNLIEQKYKLSPKIIFINYSSTHFCLLL